MLPYEKLCVVWDPRGKALWLQEPLHCGSAAAGGSSFPPVLLSSAAAAPLDALSHLLIAEHNGEHHVTRSDKGGLSLQEGGHG